MGVVFVSPHVLTRDVYLDLQTPVRRFGVSRHSGAGKLGLLKD